MGNVFRKCLSADDDVREETAAATECVREETAAVAECVREETAAAAECVREGTAVAAECVSPVTVDDHRVRDATIQWPEKTLSPVAAAVKCDESATPAPAVAVPVARAPPTSAKRYAAAAARADAARAGCAGAYSLPPQLLVSSGPPSPMLPLQPPPHMQASTWRQITMVQRMLPEQRRRLDQQQRNRHMVSAFRCVVRNRTAGTPPSAARASDADIFFLLTFFLTFIVLTNVK